MNNDVKTINMLTGVKNIIYLQKLVKYKIQTKFIAYYDSIIERSFIL